MARQGPGGDAGVPCDRGDGGAGQAQLSGLLVGGGVADPRAAEAASLRVRGPAVDLDPFLDVGVVQVLDQVRTPRVC